MHFLNIFYQFEFINYLDGRPYLMLLGSKIIEDAPKILKSYSLSSNVMCIYLRN